MAAKKKGGRRGAKTLRGSLLRAEEIARVLKLVRAGMTVRDIANITGWSRGKVHNLVVEGRKSIPEVEAKALVAEVVDRERAVIKAHWRRRAEPDHARVIQASDKVMLSALPTKAEVTGADGAPLLGPSPIEAARLVREAFGDHAAKRTDDPVDA